MLSWLGNWYCYKVYRRVFIVLFSFQVRPHHCPLVACRKVSKLCPTFSRSETLMLTARRHFAYLLPVFHVRLPKLC